MLTWIDSSVTDICQGWVRARQRGTVKQYCYENYLTPSTLLVTKSCISSVLSIEYYIMFSVSVFLM